LRILRGQIKLGRSPWGPTGVGGQKARRIQQGRKITRQRVGQQFAHFFRLLWNKASREDEQNLRKGKKKKTYQSMERDWGPSFQNTVLRKKEPLKTAKHSKEKEFNTDDRVGVK